MEIGVPLVDTLEINNISKIAIKSRRLCCDARRCCPINEKNGRPTFLLLTVLAGIFFCFGLIPFGLGLISLYNVNHEIETNMTIVGYVIDKTFCYGDSDTKPWRITIVGTFIAYSRMITDQTYYVCGWYDDDACDLAQKQYPKYSQMPIWYWDDNPKYIEKTDPSEHLITLYFGIGSFLTCLFILIVNSVLVMCCGFDSICDIHCSCRCRDPYKYSLQHNYR